MAKSTSSQDIYNSLREMIINFELYPGTRITESELAEMFKVSRTPIRSAIQRLEAEGYMSVLSKQGCFIRNIEIDELMQFYQVRKTLENYSLELACTFMTDAALKELSDEWDPDKFMDRSDNADEMESRDESFHIAIAEGGGNIVLRNYLADINRNIRVIRRIDFTNDKGIDRTYTEHHDICQHLLKRDLGAAQRSMLSHINVSENVAKTLTLSQLAKTRKRLNQLDK